MVIIKDINGMDLTEQKITGRGGKNIQRNCTKKVLQRVRHDLATEQQQFRT